MSGLWVPYPSNISTGSVSANTIAFGLGALDGLPPTVNGFSLSSTSIYMQSATSVYPGLVNSGSQTFGGVKTFVLNPAFNSVPPNQALIVSSGTQALSSIVYTSVNTGSTIASRDSNGNTAFNNPIATTTNVVSSNTLMTAGSSRIQKVLGSTSFYTFKLPDATTLINGWIFEFNNNSIGSVSVVKNDTTTLVTGMSAGSYASIICTDNSTTNGQWDVHWQMPSSAVYGTAGLQVTGTLQASGQTLVSDGSISAPGLAFINEPATGFYRKGSKDLVFVLNSMTAIEMVTVGSQTNFGIGGLASLAVGTPFSGYANFNGTANFNFSNYNQGTSAATAFYIGAGGSGANGITIENQAYANTAYIGGGGLLSAGPNLSFLNICSEISTGYITFNVAGRTLATERARLNPGNFTLNGGVNLILIGTSSAGAGLTQSANSSGTGYSFTWPIAVGANNTMLMSQGSGSALIWGLQALANTTGSISLTNQVSGILPTANMAVIAINSTSQVSGSVSLVNQVNGSLSLTNISNSYYSGYLNGATWSTTSATFADPTVSGTNALTKRQGNINTIVSSSNGVCGITFGPSAAASVYRVSAIFQGYNDSAAADNAGFQLTDGSTVIATAAVQSAVINNGTVCIHLEGIYVPGTISSVTVKIQASSGGVGTANWGQRNISTTGSVTAEWMIHQIA